MRRLTTVVVLVAVLFGCKALLRAAWEVSGLREYLSELTGRKQVLTLENGIQEGSATEFYETGEKYSEGQYRADHKFGHWQYWYQNGQLKASRYFDRNGARTGIWEEYHDNGKLAARGAFSNDQEQGEWKRWSEDGTLVERTEYVDAMLAGLVLGWHPDGSKKCEGMCAQGQSIGRWRFWKTTGEASEKTYPTPAGCNVVFECWDNGGRKRCGVVRDNARVGCWSTWNEDGSARLSYQLEGTGQTYAYRADSEVLVEGNVRGGDLVMPNGDSRMLPRVSAIPGEWSDPSLAETESDEYRVVATWIAEAKSPLEPQAAPPPNAAPAVEPSPDQLAEAAPKPALQPEFQGEFTHREREIYDEVLTQYKFGSSGAGVAGLYAPRPNASEVPKVRSDLIGKLPSECRLSAAEGGEVCIREYKGIRTLVVVMRGYLGQVCVYCVAQAKALHDMMPKLREYGVESLVVVYPGPEGSKEAYLAGYRRMYPNEQPEFDIYYDIGLELCQELNIQGGKLAYPTTLLVDEDGLVRWAYTGENEADRPAMADLINELKSWGPPKR